MYITLQVDTSPLMLSTAASIRDRSQKTYGTILREHEEIACWIEEAVREFQTALQGTPVNPDVQTNPGSVN